MSKVKSFNNKVLHFLTRNHKRKDIFQTIENARKSGFENINCDIIYNIPNQTKSIWKEDLTSLIDLDIEHISCYSLVVEQKTELYQLVKNKDIKMPDNDNSCYLYKSAQEILDKKEMCLNHANQSGKDADGIKTSSSWKKRLNIMDRRN